MRLSRYFMPITRETPKEAEVYGEYLKKLSAQEKEMDALTDKQKKLMDSEFKARKAYEDYLGTQLSEQERGEVAAVVCQIEHSVR